MNPAPGSPRARTGRTRPQGQRGRSPPRPPAGPALWGLGGRRPGKNGRRTHRLLDVVGEAGRTGRAVTASPAAGSSDGMRLSQHRSGKEATPPEAPAKWPAEGARVSSTRCTLRDPAGGSSEGHLRHPHHLDTDLLTLTLLVCLLLFPFPPSPLRHEPESRWPSTSCQYRQGPGVSSGCP